MVEKLWMRPEREVAYADHREYSDGSGVTSRDYHQIPFEE